MNRILVLCTLASLFLQGCATLELDPSRNVGGVSGANYAVLRILFATDRSHSDGLPPSTRFGVERSDLRYGVADVSIPRNHKMGALEAPSILRLEFRNDPSKHVVLLTVDLLGQSDFLVALRSRLASDQESHALVFVHGYNVNFEDAARRTAQISYDLGFKGVPILYSWPSQGAIHKYLEDDANSTWSANHLEHFLELLAKNTNGKKVFLIAHSMGGKLLTESLARLAQRLPALVPTFAEVVLAAPDIDAGYLRDTLAPRMLKAGANITLYASSEDVALRASRLFRGDLPRAGEAGQRLTLIPGIRTIDASGMGTDFLNHSYVVENRSILSDIFHLLRGSSSPNYRAGLVDAQSGGITYWRFRR